MSKSRYKEMRNIITIDRLSIDLSKRHINEAGYLVAPKSSIARSGILQYSAASLGLKNRDPNELINVYRPPAEVIKIKNNYANMPLTIQHPGALEVTPKTAKGLQIGQSGSNVSINKLQNGEVEVLVDIVVTDKDSIESVEAGDTEELSAGYYSAYRESKGVAPDGTQYEFIQHSLTPNHIALVSEGRCGSLCKVADEKPKRKENNMGEQLIDIDGVQFLVTDELAAKLQPYADAGEEDNLKLSGKKAEDEHEDDDYKNKMDDQYEDEDKADDEDEDEDDMKKKTKDMPPEMIKKMEEMKKKKKAGDKAPCLFNIDLPNGVAAVADESTIAYLSSLDSKGTKKQPVNDQMEVLKVSAAANRILGDKFDIASCDSIDAVKKEIIKSVLPVVREDQLVSADGIDSLYQVAVSTYDSNSNQFNNDIGFLGNQPTADGKQVSGRKVVSPFASILKLGRPTADTVTDKNDPFANRQMRFTGKDKKENK